MVKTTGDAGDAGDAKSRPFSRRRRRRGASATFPTSLVHYLAGLDANENQAGHVDHTTHGATPRILVTTCTPFLHSPRLRIAALGMKD